MEEHALDVMAKHQHEIWAHWMRYMFSVCDLDANGEAIIPADKVLRWRRQMETEYSHLSEAERESDRDIVKSFLYTELGAMRNHLAGGGATIVSSSFSWPIDEESSNG